KWPGRPGCAWLLQDTCRCPKHGWERRNFGPLWPGRRQPPNELSQRDSFLRSRAVAIVAIEEHAFVNDREVRSQNEHQPHAKDLLLFAQRLTILSNIIASPASE